MKVTKLEFGTFWINLSGDEVPYMDADTVDFHLDKKEIEVVSNVNIDEVFLQRTAHLNAAELDRLIHNLLILREKMENM